MLYNPQKSSRELYRTYQVSGGQVGLQGKAQSTSFPVALVCPLYQSAKVSRADCLLIFKLFHCPLFRDWQCMRQESKKTPRLSRETKSAAAFRNSCNGNQVDQLNYMYSGISLIQTCTLDTAVNCPVLSWCPYFRGPCTLDYYVETYPPVLLKRLHLLRRAVEREAAKLQDIEQLP